MATDRAHAAAHPRSHERLVAHPVSLQIPSQRRAARAARSRAARADCPGGLANTDPGQSRVMMLTQTFLLRAYAVLSAATLLQYFS